MGTTGTALLVRPEGAWVSHVGDSRAYRVRDGVIDADGLETGLHDVRDSHGLLQVVVHRQRRAA